MTPWFEDYCRRKTAAALAARPPGFTSVVAPEEHPAGMVAIGSDWSRALFDGWFYRGCADERHGLPSVSLVFVESVDGNTVADDPETLGGGVTDKHIVYEGLSRIDADAVLAGAATAAGVETVFSIWHPELVRLRTSRRRARHPAQVILTDRGDLPVRSALLYNEPSLAVVVVASSGGAAVLKPRVLDRPWVDVIDAGDPIDITRAMRELYDRGVGVISAVGGRRTADALLRADVVAELYLTTAPEPGGEPGTPLSPTPLPKYRVLLEKHGRSEEVGVRFRHLVFER